MAVSGSGPSETTAKGRKDTGVDGSGSGAVIERAEGQQGLNLSFLGFSIS